ncbi:MAG: hypothetical protein Q7S45_02205 [Candidatus Curtissbacteria bacterium]|nr:hypothetical protein [Candidatus Curtissbacteria bacterium]
MVTEREGTEGAVTTLPEPGKEYYRKILRRLIEDREEFNGNEAFTLAISTTFKHLINTGEKDSALNITHEVYGEKPIDAKQKATLAKFDALINSLPNKT